jgi:hypothetical protein
MSHQGAREGCCCKHTVLGVCLPCCLPMSTFTDWCCLLFACAAVLLCVQVLNGEVRLVPHVGVPERPTVGDGVNFPSRWQPKIPNAGTLGLEPVTFPH